MHRRLTHAPRWDVRTLDEMKVSIMPSRITSDVHVSLFRDYSMLGFVFLHSHTTLAKPKSHPTR